MFTKLLLLSVFIAGTAWAGSTQELNTSNSNDLQALKENPVQFIKDKCNLGSLLKPAPIFTTDVSYATGVQGEYDKEVITIFKDQNDRFYILKKYYDGSNLQPEAEPYLDYASLQCDPSINN